MMILKSMMKVKGIKKLLLIGFLFVNTLLAQQIDWYNAMFYKADISAKKAYEMQQNGVLLIDTRTIKEFKTLHAKGAINIPVFHEKNRKRVFNKNFLNEIYMALDKNPEKEVILICRSGSRTKLASNLLGYNNFTNVYNVKYGFAYDWLKVKLPTEK